MKKDEFVTDDQSRELYLVGRRLFEARKAMRLSQKKAAEQIVKGKQDERISDSSVSNHENGKKITIAVLNQYAKLYKKPVEAFFIEDTDADNSLQEQIDEREVMRRVLPTVRSWRRKKSYRYCQYLLVDDRELARWKKFAESEVNDSDVENEVGKSGIDSVPFAQYLRIAAEFGITLHELLCDK